MARACRVLVVEDELLLVLELESLLSAIGCDVCGTASDSAAAVALAQRLKPNVALLDVRLADGDTGIEAARQIRAKSGVPIIFVTAYTEREHLRRMRAVEPVAILTKPYDRAALKKAIAKALRG